MTISAITLISSIGASVVALLAIGLIALIIVTQK